MRLVCLECSAAYEAPDNLFGPQPREVRCNRCGFQWTVVGSPADAKTAQAVLSIGPARTPDLAPSQQPELPRPQPTILPPARPEPLAALAPPPPAAPPPQRSATLADALTGTMPPARDQSSREVARPVRIMEPAAESTRALLAGAPADALVIMPPDPEERRLSHDLDFGETDRHRISRGGGGTRRAVVILILLLILAGIAAVVFKAQIISAVPPLSRIYAQVGL